MDGENATSEIQQPPESGAEESKYAGTFFPNAQHFTVAGGVFTSNVTNNTQQTTAPMVAGFRTIPLGDINLHEIRLDSTLAVVDRQGERRKARVRRIYSAEIDGRKSRVTVALYQGKDAEEEWRSDISRYMSLRHPNIIQLYAVASNSGIHAAIFHNDMILFDDFINPSAISRICPKFLDAYCCEAFDRASRYVSSVSDEPLEPHECTMLISPATGRICADVTTRTDGYWWTWLQIGSTPTVDLLSFLSCPNPEAVVVDSFTLEEYHSYFQTQSEIDHNECDASTTINMPAVYDCRSQLYTGFDVDVLGTLPDQFAWSSGIVELSDGWSRLDVPELLRLRSSNPSSAPLALHIRWSSLPSLWAAQANYILDSLQTSTTPDNIALCNAIWFNLFVTDLPPTTPDGYLFLCPKDHFIVNHGSFRWPERATFWSLDPSGSPPMSDSEAQELGFPKLSKRIEVNARYWYRDPKVYDRLRRFHEAKGFNDSGHDVARHLGYPLLQLQREKGRGVHNDFDDSSTDFLSRESGNGKAVILETQETQGHIDSSPGQPDQVNGNDYTRVAAELNMDMVSSSFGRNTCESEMIETHITEPSVSDSPRFSQAFKSTPTGQDDSPSLDRDVRAISPWDYTDDSLVYPRNNFVFLARFVLIVLLSLFLLLDKLQQVVPRQI